MGDAPKILIICNDLEYFIRHRYPALSSDNFLRANVLVMSGGTEGAGENPANAMSFPVIPASCNRYRFSPFQDLLFFFQIVSLIKKFRPDVVHSITLKPNLLAGLAVRLVNWFRRPKIRFVAMAPGLGRVFSAHGNRVRRLRQWIVTRALRVGFKGHHAIALFENGADRTVFVDLGITPFDRTSVISGAGVDTALYKPGTAREAGKCRVVFASRLLRSKGAEVVIEAASRLQARNVPVEFIVAGDPDDRDIDAVDMTKMKLPPNLRFVGYCDDVPALLDTADVVLLPTTYQEGLPRILLEAAAMARAIVATDIEACRRIVDHGTNGYLVPCDGGSVDIDAVALAIETLALDPAKAREMGRKGEKIFWQRGFDLASVRREMASLLLK